MSRWWDESGICEDPLHGVLLTDVFPRDNRKTTTSIMLLNNTVTEVIEVTASYCSIPSETA